MLLCSLIFVAEFTSEVMRIKKRKCFLYCNYKKTKKRHEQFFSKYSEKIENIFPLENTFTTMVT